MEFPRQAVDDYLRLHRPEIGAIASVRKFEVGQSNPTFLLTTDTGRYVLRAKPPGRLLASAHAVDREFRVLQALQGSEVPVPKPLHLCGDESVLGSVFYVMAFVDGAIYLDGTLPGVDASTRRRVYDSAGRILSALNGVDVVAVGLGDFGRPRGYFERQVKRWSEQYRLSATEFRPAMEALIEWLPKNLPADSEEISLVHGDFRLDNLVVNERGHVIGVLDWELCTLGHPFADLAYQCAQWRLPAGEMRGLKGVDRQELGIPTEEEYVAAYCRRRGLATIPDWSFYLAVSLFRLAAICQGVYSRGLQGNASSTAALGFGKKTDVIAEHALEIVAGS
jgi:aminoglycoside phosphotransferase (APT) family kinase protein